MVWLPRSSGLVSQHPSRKNPVTGSKPQGSRSLPWTFRSVTRPVCREVRLASMFSVRCRDGLQWVFDRLGRSDPAPLTELLEPVAERIEVREERVRELDDLAGFLAGDGRLAGAGGTDEVR